MQTRKHAQICALRERYLLQTEYFNNKIDVKDLSYTPYTGFDAHDAEFKKTITNPDIEFNCVMETKCRYNKMNGWNGITPWDGWVLEKKKYDELMNQFKDKHYIYYILFFEDGYILFDLKQIKEFNWKTTLYPKDSYGGELIEKVECDLFRRDAIEIVDKKINIYKAYDMMSEEWERNHK